MALTIAIEGLGELDNAEATTNWGIVGSGGISIALDTEIYYQGSGSINSKLSSGKQGWVYYNHGSALNFTTTYSGQCVLIWWQVTTSGSASAINGAQTGFSVRMGSSTTVYREWRLGGSDATTNGYTAGWQCAVIDPNSTGTNDVGAYSAASVQYIGIHYDGNTASRAENVFVDSVMVGSGIRITGTETTSGAGWQEVVDYCTDRANRAWGFIQEKEPGIFTVYGTLYVGDSTQSATTTLTDSGRIFKFGDYEYFDNTATPTTASAIGDGFHGLVIEDHASFATTFQDGIIVGTDSGRSGSSFLGVDRANTTFDLYGGNNAASITKLYGTTLNKIDGGITWGNDADHHMYSCTLSGCGQFDPVGAVKIRNCVFAELWDDGTANASNNSALLWNSNIDIQDSAFIANSHTSSDVAHAIEHPAAGTFSYTNLTFSGNEVDVHFSASTGNLTINKSGTSNPTTSTNDSSGTVSFQATVTFQLTNVISGSQFTAHATFTTATPAGTYNGTGDSVVRATVSIPASLPTSGNLRLFNGTYYDKYAYTGVSGTDFTGVTPTLSQDYDGVAIWVEDFIAPTVVSTDPWSTSVEGTQDFIAMLANASGATKYKPEQFSGNTGSGFSRRVSQTEDA